MEIYQFHLNWSHMGPSNCILEAGAAAQALVLVAPAVDITEVWWSKLTVEQRQQAIDAKRMALPGDYLPVGNDSTPKKPFGGF